MSLRYCIKYFGWTFTKLLFGKFPDAGIILRQFFRRQTIRRQLFDDRYVLFDDNFFDDSYYSTRVFSTTDYSSTSFDDNLFENWPKIDRGGFCQKSRRDLFLLFLLQQKELGD